MTTRKQLILVVTLAMLSAAAFVVFGKSIRRLLEDDVFKLTYQFILMAVIGGALSLFYQRVTFDRDLAQKSDARLREMHKELLDAFNLAKRVRRVLRASLEIRPMQTPPSEVLTAAKYETEIIALMDAQFTFETFAKRSEDNELWFTNGEVLAKPLRLIEKYLNRIIQEYEGSLRTFSGTPSSKALVDLSDLAEFLEPLRAGGRFELQFKVPFRDALNSLTT